jgi:hypothetical protein
MKWTEEGELALLKLEKGTVRLKRVKVWMMTVVLHLPFSLLFITIWKQFDATTTLPSSPI